MVRTMPSDRRQQRFAELQSLALFSRQLLWNQYRHVMRHPPPDKCSADDAIAAILAVEFPDEIEPPQKPR